MIFADVPVGASIFIDANTLVYHFMPHPTLGMACADLLARIRKGEVFAATSTHVLNDVAHRVMTTEAVARFGWPVTGIAQRLRRVHPGGKHDCSRFPRHAHDRVKLGRSKGGVTVSL